MKSIFPYLLLILAAVFSACSQEKDEEPRMIIDLKQDNPQAWNEGSITVKVKTNVDFEVEVPAECTWCHYVETRSLSGYTVEFRLDDNTSGKTRNVQVAFHDKELTLREELEIIQSSRNDDSQPEPENNQHFVITHNNRTMQVPELGEKGFEAWVMWNTGMDWETYAPGLSHTYNVDAPYRLEIKGTEIEEIVLPKITGISDLDFRNF